MSTLSKHERCRKAQQKLQHVLDNLLKLSIDCDIRRLVEDHKIKSVLDLMNLCLYNDWGRDLDITTSVSRPILEDQHKLLIELVLFQKFCNGQSSDGYFCAPQSNSLLTLLMNTVFIHQNHFLLLSEPRTTSQCFLSLLIMNP